MLCHFAKKTTFPLSTFSCIFRYFLQRLMAEPSYIFMGEERREVFSTRVCESKEVRGEGSCCCRSGMGGKPIPYRRLCIHSLNVAFDGGGTNHSTPLSQNSKKTRNKWRKQKKFLKVEGKKIQSISNLTKVFVLTPTLFDSFNHLLSFLCLVEESNPTPSPQGSLALPTKPQTTMQEVCQSF